MNLLYAVPFWPSLYTPFLFREIAWMKGRGHQVAVVSLKEFPDGQINVVNFGLESMPVLQVRRHYKSDGALMRDLATLGPSQWGAPMKPGLRQSLRQGGVRHGLHRWAGIKKAVAFARAHGTQVIEAHWATEAAELARQIHLALGVPYAVRVHGGDMYRSPSPDLAEIVGDAAAICPVSQFVRDLLLGKRPVASLPVVPPVSIDPARLRVCHNGLPGTAIAQEPNAQSESQLIVGTIGRLDPEKRHADLIRAIAQLAPRFPTLKLWIIGGGQLLEPLTSLTRELSVTDRVTITGPRPWPEVMQLVKQLHVYVQSSEVEGCSLATLEGQAQGVPVVLSRTGSHEQCVDEGRNGYLFPFGEVAQLRDRLAQVLATSPAQRLDMGRASIAIVKDRFHFDKLMLRVEAILGACRDGQPLPP